MIATITHIKISLKEKSIELTSEEARAVYDELAKLFKLEIDCPPQKEFILMPAPFGPPPVIIDGAVPTWPQPWTWCSETLHMQIE